jgi:hypothetical protein
VDISGFAAQLAWSLTGSGQTPEILSVRSKHQRTLCLSIEYVEIPRVIDVHVCNLTEYVFRSPVYFPNREIDLGTPRWNRSRRAVIRHDRNTGAVRHRRGPATFGGRIGARDTE